MIKRAPVQHVGSVRARDILRQQTAAPAVLQVIQQGQIRAASPAAAGRSCTGRLGGGPSGRAGQRRDALLRGHAHPARPERPGRDCGRRQGLLRSEPLTEEVLRACDRVVVATEHTQFAYDWIVRHARQVFDTRNATRRVAHDRHKIIRIRVAS